MQQKMIQFSGDVSLPAVGQGTWYMGEDASQRKTEVAALRAGIELGLTLIDTAEMYADGGAEKVVGEALTGLREKVFLVSGNDSNLLIVFYVQIMPDDFVMQLHR
ncbi:aldo/keto reductase, partial [Escherichia coli]